MHASANMRASSTYNRNFGVQFSRRQFQVSAKHSSRRARAATVSVQAAKREYEVVRELLPDNQVKLTITVPGVICQEGFTKTVKTLRRDVVGSLKGFRTDKIPLSEVISRVGGQKAFDAAVLEEILIRAMQDVMPVHATRSLPGSEHITSNVPQLMASFDPAKPLTFEVSYDRIPDIEWSRPYAELEVNVQDSGNLDTDKEAVEGLIRQYLKQESQRQVVADRGLQRGDGAIISMHIMPKGGRQPYPGLSNDKFFFDADQDMLDLTDNMLGMVPGEERTWDFVFPYDWHVELWRGQTATAKIKLQELFSYLLPEFNDEFVAQHYPQFESAEDLRTNLLSSTSLARMKDVEAQIQDAIVTQVSACVSSPVPEALLRAQAEKEYQAKLLELAQKGLARPEDIEAQLTEDALEAFISAERAGLQERCKYVMASDAIAEEQQLQVEMEGLDDEVARAKAQCKQDGIDFDEDTYRQEMAEKLRYAAVMQWLQQNLKINVQEWQPQQQDTQQTAASAR